jgi:polyhydroxyalkanoate synthesis regulator phasin
MEGLKNFIYAGIGLAASTSEKVKNTVDELVEKGKISDTEGKKIVDDFFKSTGEMKEDFESRLKKFNDELTEKFEFLKKNNKVVETLEEKINELEGKLKEASTKATAAVKKTTKKATAKKTTTKKATK